MWLGDHRGRDDGALVVTVRPCWATDTITDCTSSRSHFHSIQYSPICSVRDKFSVSWVDFPCCGSDLGPRRQRALLRHNVTRSKHRTGYKRHSYHVCGSSATRFYLFSTTDVRFVKHFVMRQLSIAFIRFFANSYLTLSRMVWCMVYPIVQRGEGTQPLNMPIV